MQGYSFQGLAVSAKPVLNLNCFFFFFLPNLLDRLFW